MDSFGDEGTITTGNVLIACVDVDYRSFGAVAAGLWFRGWQSSAVEHRALASFSTVAEYEPGAFFRRELPCLLDVLARGPQADVIVVDGYVWLGGGAAGLGAHLYAAIGRAVVGVAKTRFASATDAVPVCRGGSRRPLFVSAVGMAVEVAAKSVVAMHGPHRIPTLLKLVDSVCRSAFPDAGQG